MQGFVPQPHHPGRQEMVACHGETWGSASSSSTRPAMTPNPTDSGSPPDTGHCKDSGWHRDNDSGKWAESGWYTYTADSNWYADSSWHAKEKHSARDTTPNPQFSVPQQMFRPFHLKPRSPLQSDPSSHAICSRSEFILVGNIMSALFSLLQPYKTKSRTKTGETAQRMVKLSSFTKHGMAKRIYLAIEQHCGKLTNPETPDPLTIINWCLSLIHI